MQGSEDSLRVLADALFDLGRGTWLDQFAEDSKPDRDLHEVHGHVVFTASTAIEFALDLDRDLLEIAVCPPPEQRLASLDALQSKLNQSPDRPVWRYRIARGEIANDADLLVFQANRVGPFFHLPLLAESVGLLFQRTLGEHRERSDKWAKPFNLQPCINDLQRARQQTTVMHAQSCATAFAFESRDSIRRKPCKDGALRRDSAVASGIQMYASGVTDFRIRRSRMTRMTSV